MSGMSKILAEFQIINSAIADFDFTSSFNSIVTICAKSLLFLLVEMILVCRCLSECVCNDLICAKSVVFDELLINSSECYSLVRSSILGSLFEHSSITIKLDRSVDSSTQFVSDPQFNAEHAAAHVKI